MADTIPTRLSGATPRSRGRQFGLTVGVAFAVLSAVARWRGHPVSFVTLGGLGAALILAGLAIPAALGPVERVWMTVAQMLSKVTTPIFMSIVYFGILTPIGLLRRLGGNPLKHRAGPEGFWLDRRQSPRSILDRQF